MTSGQTPWKSAAGGAIVAVVLVLMTADTHWRSGFEWAITLFNLSFALIVGVTTGASLGALSWALARPVERVTRAMVVAVAVTWCAWGAFLVTTPPLSSAEFASITAARAQRDGDHGLDLVTDQPTVMAGRWFGGFRSMPIFERALVGFAGPVPDVVAYFVVPDRYAGTAPTRRESYVIAAIAFAGSTAFWPGAVCLVGQARRRWGRPHAHESTN